MWPPYFMNVQGPVVILQMLVGRELVLDLGLQSADGVGGVHMGDDPGDGGLGHSVECSFPVVRQPDPACSSY